MTLLHDTNSPLSADQAEQLNQLLQTLRTEQMTWLSGYLAGLCASSAPAANSAEPVARSESLPELTILYGSQTGNSEGVAQLAAERAESRGFAVKLADMGEFGKPQLKNAANLLVVVSTHGDGEPPDSALEFHELLAGRKAPPLKGTRYAVLALGDSSYDRFCQTGKDFDTRLQALGGERLLERVDCDVDYEDAASAWIDTALERFGATMQRSATVLTLPGAKPAAPVWSKKNPFPATVLDNIRLNGRGSAKRTHHIELSLEESGLSFEPGDALGVVARNSEAYVDELLDTLRLDPDQSLENGDTTLRQALIEDYEVTTLTRPVLQRWAELSGSERLRDLLAEERKTELREYTHGRELIDLVQDYPVTGLDGAEFAGALRKLPARLYSIASSHKASPDEVHLTVGAVRYASHGRERFGVASTHLAGLEEGATLPVYVDTNKNFKLPADPDAPVIMIGPGTGVAPFRAFLAEREALGAGGRNWLLFGEQHFLTDFLYQTDWLNWRKHGLLNRLDVAFSRDQANKVYVQHRLRDNAVDVWTWLQDGAHVYVCGDAERMAPDVHQALFDIVRQQGGLGEDAATEYLRQLQRDKRYQRDVY